MSGLTFSNQRIKSLRRLLGRRSARLEAGRFVVEGPTLVLEAVAAGWTCHAQYVSIDAPAATIDGAGDVVTLASGVLERVASTDTPQAPLVEVELPVLDATSVLGAASAVFVLDRVQDPGNVGTILRSVEAAGFDAVVLTEGSADAFQPKVVRASAGAVFHVPIVTATIDDVRAAGLTTIGTSSHTAAGRIVDDYTAASYDGRIALVVGNEAAGLPEEWADEGGPIDRWVTVRHRGRSESLNVAMAATVLAFETMRARSQ